MIKLIGIDVDGTLVGSSGIVPPEVWDAAERARVRGIQLVLCSGRPAFGVAFDYARRSMPAAGTLPERLEHRSPANRRIAVGRASASPRNGADASCAGD
ncbi:MAG: HAD hydrolase family protein [Gammaproteobacteria bacterium]